MEKLATSNVQSPARPVASELALNNWPTFSQLHQALPWCGCTSGKQWGYLVPAVSVTWIKEVNFCQSVVAVGCSMEIWGGGACCSQESIPYKIPRSEDKYSSCLQMQRVGCFSSTSCVRKAQLASSGYNGCIVWKNSSRPRCGTLEMEWNTAFTLTRANYSLLTKPAYTSAFVLKLLKLYLVALPPTAW